MGSCRHHLRGREMTSKGRVRDASVVRSIESTVCGGSFPMQGLEMLDDLLVSGSEPMV